jgi:hypothetical protein
MAAPTTKPDKGPAKPSPAKKPAPAPAKKPAPAPAKKSAPAPAAKEPAKMHIAVKVAVPVLLLLVLLWGMLRFWKCANGFGSTLLKALITFLVAFGAAFGTMFAPPFAKYKDALLYSWGLSKDKDKGGKANVNVVLPVMALFVIVVFVPVIWIWTRKCTDYRKLMKMNMGRANNKAAA